MENIGTQSSEVKRAEPESEHHCSPVLRRSVQSPGEVEGPGAERREAPPALGLPCLFETTASKDEAPPLPGPRKKQAEALTQNIQWMAATFGKERVGFLTLTLGDFEAGGRFRNLRDRKEAQRRFHSLLTNEISKRYVCGVTVMERHKNGGIHFHLAVVCKEDIRGQIDFAASFPPKGVTGKPVYRPDYSTANDAIKREGASTAHRLIRLGGGQFLGAISRWSFCIARRLNVSPPPVLPARRHPAALLLPPTPAPFQQRRHIRTPDCRFRGLSPPVFPPPLWPRRTIRFEPDDRA
jgi:hypothetical protein